MEINYNYGLMLYHKFKKITGVWINLVSLQWDVKQIFLINKQFYQK